MGKRLNICKIVFLMSLLMLTSVLYAEKNFMQDTIKVNDTVELSRVEIKPTFRGGNPAEEFAYWINANLRYPTNARKQGIQGVVVVKFKVNIDGSVSDVTVIQGVHYELDAEAVRVVSRSPKWSPGKVNGEAVAVVYRYPIRFKLR